MRVGRHDLMGIVEGGPQINYPAHIRRVDGFVGLAVVEAVENWEKHVGSLA